MMLKRGPPPPSHASQGSAGSPESRDGASFFFFFYYENKTNAPGEGSMITRNSTFYHFYSVVMRPALQ